MSGPAIVVTLCLLVSFIDSAMKADDRWDMMPWVLQTIVVWLAWVLL
jgi:hypothetical protein